MRKRRAASSRWRQDLRNAPWPTGRRLRASGFRRPWRCSSRPAPERYARRNVPCRKPRLQWNFMIKPAFDQAAAPSRRIAPVTFPSVCPAQKAGRKAGFSLLRPVSHSQPVSKFPNGMTSLYSSRPFSIFRLALPFSDAGTMRSSATLPNRFSRRAGSTVLSGRIDRLAPCQRQGRLTGRIRLEFCRQRRCPRRAAKALRSSPNWPPVHAGPARHAARRSG